MTRRKKWGDPSEKRGLKKALRLRMIRPVVERASATFGI